MTDFMEREIKWLINDKISLTKILSLNGKSDTLNVKYPDFELELDVFKNADINKPALSDKYTVDSIFSSDKLYKIRYTAKSDKLKIRKLSVQFDGQNKVVFVDIRSFNGSPMTKNVQYLTYQPNSGYVIKNEQYFMGNKDEIIVEGLFK